MKAEMIADAFLNKVPIEAVESGEGLHKIKLQKLLFLAQEEYLYRYEKPLFEEKIEAWEHGFVVREIWNKYADLPYYIIKSLPATNPKISKKIQEVIDFIWEEYGEKDTWYLRDLTHSYRTWIEKRAEKYYGKGEITPEEILSYKKECEKAKQEAREYIDKLAKEFL